MLNDAKVLPIDGRAILQTPVTQPPQLFVVLLQDCLASEEPNLTVSQELREPSESVLYFEDGMLRTESGALTRPYYVDVGESDGLVLEPPPAKNRISRICQSAVKSQVFATCQDNNIQIWRWIADLSGREASQRAIAPECYFDSGKLGPKEITYGMCLLSRMPERAAKEHKHVVLTLTAHPNRWNLMITMISAGRNKIEFRQIIGDRALLEAARTGELIFQLSHSENILILAGKKVARIFQIRTEPEVRLDQILDLSSEYEKDFCIKSCLCMPPPASISAIDWVVLGEDHGGLCGFLWKMNSATQTIEKDPKNCGRFSSKQLRHTPRVPVSLLAATCERFQEDEFCSSLSFRGDSFISIGDDGKQFRWNLQSKNSGSNTGGGWVSREDDSLRALLDESRSAGPCAARKFLAARCSRLVPDRLYVVDRHSRISQVQVQASPAVTQVNRVPTPSRSC
jgi:hypothetical protein